MGLKDIEDVVRSWVLSGMSTLQQGATVQELEDAGRFLGMILNEDLISLYTYCNGGEILGGNLQLYPLCGGDLSLVGASDFLRRNHWSVPHEVIIFAGDGQGGAYGLWSPHGQNSQPLVVEIGGPFEGSLAITGMSLSGFLRGRSAYYALLLQAPVDAINALAIPNQFTSKCVENLDDDDYEAIMRWANPDLPEYPVSSDKARLREDEVRRLARAALSTKKNRADS